MSEFLVIKTISGSLDVWIWYLADGGVYASFVVYGFTSVPRSPNLF